VLVPLPAALSIAAAVLVLLSSVVVLLTGTLQVAGPAAWLRRQTGHPAEEAAIARARQRLRGHR
jgi:hypothetical protein